MAEPVNTELWKQYNGKGFAAEYAEYADRANKDVDGNAIVDTYATKSEIPQSYVESAVVSGNTLTLTPSSGEAIVFTADVHTVSKSIYQIPDENESVLIGTRKYKIVTIGNQQWMAENLDYAWDGLIINDTGSSSEPRAYYYGRGSKDTYGIDGTYKCGLLYNHPAVVYLHNNMGTLLPAGWDVPTESDWQTLLDAVGGASAALSKLKAKPASVSTTYPPQAWGGTDDYEFNILPVGFMDNNLYAASLNTRTMLWTLSSDSGAYRRCVDFDTNVSSVGFGSFNMLYDLSVRLVKNITPGA
jgi:uncharacterized protein (TIGR02145 family)